MAPPGPRTLQADIGAGTVLAGRYRLEQELPAADGDPPDATRWRAVDDVLARPVEVLLLLAGGRRAAAARVVLDAAATAGTVVSPVLAQVYDAALEEVPAQRYGRAAGTVDVGYVVTEAVPGRSLTDVLAQDGPLEPGRAAALVLRAAEGLRAAHARGVTHGGLHPGTLRLPDTDADDAGVRLLDTAVGAALDRTQRTAPPDPDDDVRALVGCLYAALTGRWPGKDVPGPSGGLPPAPLAGGREGRTCSPRQVRAGVPRSLEQVVVKGLATPSPLRTAADLVAALHAAADAEAAARAPAPPRRSLPPVPAPVRRWVPLALVALLLVVIGAVSYSTGRTFGTVQNTPGELEALVESTPSPVPGRDAAGERVDLLAPGVVVTAFDPPPGDGAENPAAVPNAVDGDPATAWDTERYDTSGFGNLKTGVGLLVDLGQPVPLGQLEVGLTPGTDVELRAADAVGETAAQMPLVASVTDSEAVARLVPTQPVTARYVLVWLTRLPADGERFRSSVSELLLVRA